VIFNVPRLVPAALRGGSGKTTISLGLIAAWRDQGRRIAPFKKGPDYIDAGWLAQAAGAPCYNLDPYFMSPETIVDSFARRSAGADIALIEGNRGLYDGTDAAGTYSTAELAKLLRAPVVLVIHCTKATRTLAAIALGCKVFDPEVELAGVILNEVATGRHEKVIREAIENYAGLPVLGAIPRVGTTDLPERHLGLVPHQEHPRAKQVLDLLGGLVRDYCDLERIRTIAENAPPLEAPDAPIRPVVAPSSVKVKVGVIRDSAFQFYYPENLEALERLGAELVVFSSLDASILPEVDALYLGGGFPETHAELLAQNVGLRDSIRRAVECGLPVYAECGGLMYLGQSLVLKGNTYPMAGVYPVSFSLEEKPQGHGYTRARADRENPYYPLGAELIGHEFHYSRPLDYDPARVNLVLEVSRGHGFDRGRDGLLSHNCLAMYTHLHALGNAAWAEALVRLAVERRSAQCR
jgi:cobyrinic acid a,c-diamide synthase